MTDPSGEDRYHAQRLCRGEPPKTDATRNATPAVLSGNPINIGGLPLPSDAPLFLALIAPHVAAGLVCVIAGVIAMLSRKAHGRHPQAGAIYYWALAVVFVTMSTIGLFRWSEDYHLVILGVLSFLSATIGREARRRLWRNWARFHMAGMGASYMLLLTAFYVDNGPNLPLWRLLPHITFWFLPAAIGVPILGYALVRHPLVRRQHFWLRTSGPS